MIKKGLISKTISRIVDEGLSRKTTKIDDISYQAYAINYEQVKQFLVMISEIEQSQIKNPDIIEAIKRENPSEDIEDQKIRCYVPVEENGDDVTFSFKKFDESKLLTTSERVKANPELISGASEIHINNTCRTTSKNILEAILGFVTDISSYFFIAPKHRSKLIAGRPETESFYILPLPPNCVNASEAQKSVLKKLYRRLEEIPMISPNAVETRQKFDALKSIYNDIAGKNNLSAESLIGKILEHENKNRQCLFEKRSPHFFSRLFSLSSTTKNMFDEMKASLKKL